MKNIATESVVVVLDGTQRTNDLVGELVGEGKAVTAVGTTFRDVVPVMSGAVYALVADIADPEQWETALLRAEKRNGAVNRVVDPAGLLAARAA